MTPTETVLAYIRAIEARAPFETFLHPEMQLTEHPNKISPAGTTADLAAMLAASERGKALMARERYAIRHTIAEGDRVVVQLAWTGTLHDGRELRAQICSVFELRDGTIFRQEQYDCFG